jgi:hypothetical protein
MITESRILVVTPLFRQVRDDIGPGVNILHFDPARPREMLLEFRRLAEGHPPPSAYVLDVGRFSDETEWAFVSDAVGRAGASPLRGLGPIMKEPFVDVTRLYHVPEGNTGVEVVALGDRYLDDPALPADVARGRTVCSHLHAAAILAHTEELRVTGILVSAAALPAFDIDRALRT